MRYPLPQGFVDWQDWAQRLIQALDSTPAAPFVVGGLLAGDVRGGNYLEVEPDGTIELLGNATTFRDELGDITQISVVGTGIAVNNTDSTMDFATTCNPTNDYLYTNFQFNHDRLNGAKVFPHVHWFQAQNAGVNFLVSYRWQRNGQAKVTAWTNYPVATLAYPYTSGTLVQISYGAGITPPSGDNVSDILQVRLTRDKTNATGVFSGSDTYSITAQALSLDVHIEQNTFGSRTEFSK